MQLGGTRFTGQRNLQDAGEVQAIESLKAADNHDLGPLLASALLTAERLGIRPARGACDVDRVNRAAAVIERNIPPRPATTSMMGSVCFPTSSVTRRYRPACRADHAQQDVPIADQEITTIDSHQNHRGFTVMAGMVGDDLATMQAPQASPRPVGIRKPSFFGL
jgi:hypothetical protein